MILSAQNDLSKTMSGNDMPGYPRVSSVPQHSLNCNGYSGEFSGNQQSSNNSVQSQQQQNAQQQSNQQQSQQNNNNLPPQVPQSQQNTNNRFILNYSY